MRLGLLILSLLAVAFLVAFQAQGLAWFSFIHCTNSTGHGSSGPPQSESFSTNGVNVSQCHGKKRNSQMCRGVIPASGIEYTVDCEYHAPINRTFCVARVTCPNQPGPDRALQCGSVDGNVFAGAIKEPGDIQRGFVKCDGQPGQPATSLRCDDEA